MRIEPDHARSLPSPEYLRLERLPASELDRMMLRGESPSIDALVGREYRGANVPAFASLLGIKKFIKGFFRSDGRDRRSAAGLAMGYNVAVRQNGLRAPWIPRSGRRFGFYRLAPVDPTSRDNAYLNAVLLDYGQGGNFPLDPTGRLRDYVVRVQRGSDELLLGKAYLALGPARVPVGHFLLERLGE